MSEAPTPARPVLPSESTEKVSLRELEQRLEAIEKLMNERTRYEREILSTRENSLKEALQLADVETKRRLDELNHAHELAAQNWARSLPREMFEQWKEEFSKWRDGVTRALTKSEPYAEGLASLSQRLTTIENASNKVAGAFVLLGIMGLSGVLALILGLARLAGMLQ